MSEAVRVRRSFADVLRDGLDARIIYVLVVLALTGPLVFKVRLPPAPMEASASTFEVIDALKPEPGKLVVIAADWGPGTTAENQPQTELVMEHLLRKRVPFALMSIYQLASPMLKDLPLQVVARLEKESPAETWEYGKDWVNLGYQVNGSLSLQSMARAEDIHTVLKTDVSGTPLAEIPVMKDMHSIKNVQMLVQITGLVGVFNTWLQFFRADTYVPPMVHGCTSITIPDAYIYYSSKQILGFFEGIAGAAWYEQLLNKLYPGRVEVATQVNTGLAFAQLVILGLIVLGNIGYFLGKKEGR